MIAATAVLTDGRSASGARRATWRWGRDGPALGVGLVLGWLVLAPLGLLLYSVFKPTGFPTDPGFSLDNLTRTYGDAGFWELAWTTARFSLGATTAALVCGAALAWAVERTDMPWRGTVRALVILPMATPPILLAIAWVMLLSPRTGAVNRGLMALLGLETAPFDIYTMGGMIFVEGLSLVPSTFLILAPAFRNMDPSLEEAALVSGGGTWRLLGRVVLPLMAPSLLAAGIFLLIVGFVVFDIPGAIGMPAGIFVLSSRIYYLANDNPTGLPDYGTISAMALFFLVLLLALALAYQRLTRRASRFATITGKGFRPRRFRLGPWRWVALALALAYFGLAVVAPLAILVWTSLMPYLAPVSLKALGLVTLANHRAFLDNPFVLGAAGNSLIIAVVAATVVAALSVLVSWIVVKSKARGRRLIDILAFLPLAIPGVIIAVALIYLYLTVTVLPVYGSIWIIAIAYVTTYLSFGSRATHGVLMQLHDDLEDAARTAGAGWWRTFRRVVLPLAASAIAAVWVWVFAHCLRELTSALMLQGRDNDTVPTLLFDYWTGGEPNKAAAVGVWLIGALLFTVILWQLLQRRAALRLG